MGAGFALSLVNLRQVQGISDRVADNTGLDSLRVAARVSGSSRQFRAQGGVQYDTAQVHFGAAVRTPGLTMYRKGLVTLDGTVDLGAPSLGASLFDARAARLLNGDPVHTRIDVPTVGLIYSIDYQF